MPVGAVHVKARADRCGDGGLHQIHLAAAGLDDSVHDRALLHAGDAARDAHEHARLEQAEAGHPVDQLLEHGGGHVVVGDDPGGDGVHRRDVRGRAAQHFPRVLSHFDKPAVLTVYGYDGGFAQADALAAHIQKRGVRSQIHGNISFDKEYHIFRLLTVIVSYPGGAPPGKRRVRSPRRPEAGRARIRKRWLRW